MKIALLALANSIHTARWANGLADRGHEVSLISMHKSTQSFSDKIHQYPLKFSAPWGYFANKYQLQSLLSAIKPDILHAHFASGYGTLARISGFHPSVLSVWGSDVYKFPVKSPLHHKIITENLCAADWICATSHIMAQYTRNLTSCDGNKISVIPFGIDCNIFSPSPSLRDENYITIGTVKTLAFKYGIDTLIRAFTILHANLEHTQPEIASKLRLIIVGGRPESGKIDQTDFLKQLCFDLNIQKQVIFAGQVSHEAVPLWLNRFDIYAALSRDNSESFGVAILEASACEIPVVVSDVGGLPEVVDAGKTGFVVPHEDPKSAAKALEQLILDEDLRRKMGKAGRKRVLDQYQWKDNLSTMENLYRQVWRSSKDRGRTYNE